MRNLSIHLGTDLEQEMQQKIILNCNTDQINSGKEI